MFSVVIPLYNKATYIAETLESVLGQTFQEFEIVVVDDGSTDDSASVVRRFDDPRIRLIGIENSGVSVARNTGMEAAKFPWIAFLDADDWWAPEFLENINQTIKDYPNHSIFATGRSRIFGRQIERYDHEFLPADGQTAVMDYIRVISKYLPLVNASNAVIEKAFMISRGSFRPIQRKHEDHDLWLRLCWDHSVVFCNKNLSFYRKQISDSGSQKHYRAKDFFVYATTLTEIRSQLEGQQLEWMQQYLNPFILITYFRYYGSYSSQERKDLFKLCSQLLTGKYLRKLKFVHWFPFKKGYKIIKLLRK